MRKEPRTFKLCAGGNDFLVADARDADGWDAGAEGARRACRRHLGAGADGLIALLASSRADAAFVLRNSDGSRAAFSGNGARCAARLLVELGAGHDGSVTLEVGPDVVSARVQLAAEGGAARVDVALAAPRDVRLALRLPDGSPAQRGDFAIVGVPYLAVKVGDVDALDLASVGPPLRNWRDLPEGANVAFWEEPPSRDAPVRLRTWERGVEGETLSSGTGCAMVALAIALQGEGDGERTVDFDARSRIPMSVVVTRTGGAVTALRLRGDARLLCEILPGPDLLASD